MWQKELWLIDHGASLYFHHTWNNWEEQSLKPFVQVKDHVLLPWASEIEEVDENLSSESYPEKIVSILDLIPMNGWFRSRRQTLKKTGKCISNF